MYQMKYYCIQYVSHEFLAPAHASVPLFLTHKFLCFSLIIVVDHNRRSCPNNDHTFTCGPKSYEVLSENWFLERDHTDLQYTTQWQVAVDSRQMNQSVPLRND